MSAPAPLLELRNVTKRYDALSILAGTSLTVSHGETLAIVGPSGSGKSTLLQIIGTLDRATSGEVLLNGNNLAALDELQLAEVRNQQLGFVFQSHYLLPQCTVIENVLVPTLAGSHRRKEVDSVNQNVRLVTSAATETVAARAERLLKRVGLQDRLHHRPGQLSGGERQRVAIARALVTAPACVLADEPTGNLDRETADGVFALMLGLARSNGSGLVVVTHDASLAGRCDRVVTLVR